MDEQRAAEDAHGCYAFPQSFELDQQAEADAGLPPAAPLPRHARLVLIGDFLSPLDEVRGVVGALASIPVSGHILQVLDPAEALLPYSGRVRFRGMERESETLVPRVEGIRAGYAEALTALLRERRGV